MKIAYIVTLRTNRESLPPWKNLEQWVRLSLTRLSHRSTYQSETAFARRFEIPLIAKTDAIKIIKHAMTGAGRIEAVQFYTVADKGDKK